jgi:hypothetical protein
MSLNIDRRRRNRSAAHFAAKQTGENRNALVRWAVSEWLNRHGKPQWPDKDCRVALDKKTPRVVERRRRELGALDFCKRLIWPNDKGRTRRPLFAEERRLT